VIDGLGVCVVMPAFNAAATLERTFEEIPFDLVDRVILVDDGSRDGTSEISARLGVETIVHDSNLGYGANQKTCYREALRRGADVVVMLHPDYQYTPKLLPAMAEKPIQEVLELPSVRDRVRQLLDQDREFREKAVAHTRLDGKVIVTDFRTLNPVPVGNRFLVYTLFPEATVSVRIQHAASTDEVSVSAGRSIFNRESRANIGVVMSLYGGGGQPGAGACVVPAAGADQKVDEIVAALKRNA